MLGERQKPHSQSRSATNRWASRWRDINAETVLTDWPMLYSILEAYTAFLGKDVFFQLPWRNNTYRCHQTLLVWWQSRTILRSNVAPLVWTVWNNLAATLETSASRLNGEMPAAGHHQGKSLNHLLVAQTCCSVLVKCTTRPPSANGHLKIATRTRCASPFLRSKASDEDSPSAPLTQCPEAGSVLGRRGRAEGNGPRTNSGWPAAALHS